VTLPELPPLTGIVTIQPVLDGRVAQLELWIDGSVVQTVTGAPWTLTWDLTNVAPGTHTLAVRAVGPGLRARATAAVTLVTIPPPQQVP
jgi:hypothetical protein